MCDYLSTVRFHADVQTGVVCITGIPGDYQAAHDLFKKIVRALNDDPATRLMLANAVKQDRTMLGASASKAYADRDRLHKGIVEIAVQLGIGTATLQTTSIADQYDELIGRIKAALPPAPAEG